jgi:hypothetical protein
MPKPRKPSATSPQGAAGTKHRETPAERSIDVSVRDSFPASDPIAPTAIEGARAVPPQRMMRGDDHEIGGADGVPLVACFTDYEKAKLAVEALVRDAPLDRRRTSLREGGEGAPPGGALVTVRAAALEDAKRLAGMLEHAGGTMLGEAERSRS